MRLLNNRQSDCYVLLFLRPSSSYLSCSNLIYSAINPLMLSCNPCFSLPCSSNWLNSLEGLSGSCPFFKRHHYPPYSYSPPIFLFVRSNFSLEGNLSMMRSSAAVFRVFCTDCAECLSTAVYNYAWKSVKRSSSEGVTWKSCSWQMAEVSSSNKPTTGAGYKSCAESIKLATDRKYCR
jgi:hypothetical protein